MVLECGSILVVELSKEVGAVPCHLNDLVWSAETVCELCDSIGLGLALDGDPDHADVVQLEQLLFA